MSASLFPHNLLYRPLGMDIMLFTYGTVPGHFSDVACFVANSVKVAPSSYKSVLVVYYYLAGNHLLILYLNSNDIDSRLWRFINIIIPGCCSSVCFSISRDEI